MPKLDKNINTSTTDKFSCMPDENGHFGLYGGRFVSETLMGPLEELEQAYKKYKDDPEFNAEFISDLKHYVGRPSPLYHAERWSEQMRTMEMERTPEPAKNGNRIGGASWV